MSNKTKVGNLKNLIKDNRKSVVSNSTAGTMNSASSGNCQVYLRAGDYYCESSCDCRGAVADINEGITVYDISTFIKEPTIESLKNAFFNILHEKIKDNCAAFEGLTDRMKKDNYLPSTAVCDREELFNEFFALDKKVSVPKGEKNNE